MNVLLLTVFIGAALVLFFIFMFLRDMADPRGSSERDALLPLAAEKPRTSSNQAAGIQHSSTTSL